MKNDASKITCKSCKNIMEIAGIDDPFNGERDPDENGCVKIHPDYPHEVHLIDDGLRELHGIDNKVKIIILPKRTDPLQNLIRQINEECKREKARTCKMQRMLRSSRRHRRNAVRRGLQTRQRRMYTSLRFSRRRHAVCSGLYTPTEFRFRNDGTF